MGGVTIHPVVGVNPILLFNHLVYSYGGVISYLLSGLVWFGHGVGCGLALVSLVSS